MKGICQFLCKKCKETAKEHDNMYLYNNHHQISTFSFLSLQHLPLPLDKTPNSHIIFTILIHVIGLIFFNISGVFNQGRGGGDDVPNHSVFGLTQRYQISYNIRKYFCKILKIRYQVIKKKKDLFHKPEY